MLKRKLIYLLLIVLAVSLGIYLALHGQNYFNRHTIRLIREWIESFGVLAPLAVIALIILSTVIPPLPLPVPLVEIAAGITLGFIEGAIVVWIGQIISSLIAFWIARTFGRGFFKKISSYKGLNVYEKYLVRKGPLAIIIIRAAMAAPMNLISYLAGLTTMKALDFALATALGTIPESIIFTFVGTRLRTLHFNLWYIFILLIVTGFVGWILTLIMFKFVKTEEKVAKA